MQIVIDIPQKVYDEALSGDGTGAIWAGYVKNGIPLPKGHGNLIDADAVMRELSVVSSRPIKSLMYIIKLAPIIIEADKEE